MALYAPTIPTPPRLSGLSDTRGMPGGLDNGVPYPPGDGALAWHSPRLDGRLGDAAPGVSARGGMFGEGPKEGLLQGVRPGTPASTSTEGLRLRISLPCEDGRS
mmetsp:Transcript_56033/g.131128  ORF Transcript_56033/g.131128 Transcript_56033/m.131128 type:complete len:104 (-) Transcript_56033:1614-1925(-)